MSKDIYWLNKDSRKFLERDYLTEDETPEQRIRDIADAAERYLGIEGFADKFELYMHRGFYSLSTPIWSNFGRERGAPISCFGSYIPDNMNSILCKLGEIGAMSKIGGGTSGYFGAIRPRGSAIGSGGTATGVHHQLTVFDSLVNYVSQGNVRRGSFAAYLPIDHGDIEEFLAIRGEGNDIQDLSIGVTITDEWMKSMTEGDKDKRKIWGQVIKKRFESGYPYIFFTDNANNQAPQVYKDKGLKINHSNLCTEIFLPSNSEESFVCDLGSMNDFYFEEWKDTDAIEVLTFLLDAAMTEFIEKASKIKFMEKAVNFAVRHRALGIGRMGYHSLLQSRMIPFESLEARNINLNIQINIQEKSLEASKKLAEMFGECEMTKGLGRRNTTTQAIAPTTSSAFIMQVSQSIEPWMSNYMIKDLAKGKFLIKNVLLEKLLESKGKNTGAIWDSIMKQQGSVLHLDFLTDLEKTVFKTAREISQEEIIRQAAQRQKYIDQGQSLNIYITADTTAKEVNRLMILAHDLGIKSLYYQHNTSAASDFAKNFVNCTSCE